MAPCSGGDEPVTPLIAVIEDDSVECSEYRCLASSKNNDVETFYLPSHGALYVDLKSGEMLDCTMSDVDYCTHDHKSCYVAYSDCCNTK